ncbi:MAG: trigger factor, partial [Xanthomonadales bacterium]|nr:trigger factor [Xanthomonadales bacterium]
MQVTVENSGGLQRRLTVQVPAEEVQGKIDARLKEIGKTARMKGFRPGRIPMTVLKQRYGGSVRNEVLSQTMQSSLAEAIAQEKIQPAGNPVIESVPDLNGTDELSFTALIEVYPEFDKIDVSALELTAPQTEVSDDDVSNMLQTLREQRQSWEEVERKAEKGDQVLFEYAAENEAGRVPEEGMTLLAVPFGTSGFDALEDLLGGLAPGETGEADLTFPEDFSANQLAGKEAKVSVKVNSVRESSMPELDEAFIRSFGVESGALEDMQSEVRNNLERELTGARLTYLKTQLVKRLLDAHAELEVPESLIQQEAAQLQAMAAQRQGKQADPAEAAAFEEPARQRVRAGLLMGEIARQNDIAVDGAKVRQAIEMVASTYEQADEVVQMYYNNPDMLRAIESSVLEEQVVEWALEHASVSSQDMVFTDLINAAAESR